MVPFDVTFIAATSLSFVADNTKKGGKKEKKDKLKRFNPINQLY